MRILKNIILFLISLILISCYNKGIISGSELNQEEIEFIESLNLLEKNEEIIQFDSQLTIEKSGNFYTNKKVASYWISDNSEENKIDFAYYKDIKSIQIKRKDGSWTYSSYLEIEKKNGEIFKVYVDDEKEENNRFFQQVLQRWQESTIANSGSSQIPGLIGKV